MLYDDDGISFNHRQGEFMRIQMVWEDAERRLTLRLAPGSRMLSPQLALNVRVAGTSGARAVTFTGSPVEVRL